ncbi:hypothetical protein MCA2135 [Methylococcus capsulatus str. Bath]|uniref:Uncharacterized protein n=1 Tax=Methylococcus capsulatus (strain ATCC 33009 / NCIMB 11132 / Bath) TaxID=243233 RepID=Q605Y7_METCA|nr:hypothetical protein MCA2135 [Methylococcus capsulatus str. Bath]
MIDAEDPARTSSSCPWQGIFQYPARRLRKETRRQG